MNPVRTSAIVAATVIGCSVLGCSPDMTPAVAAAIRQQVASNESKAGTPPADVRRFYEQRANAPVWVEKETTVAPEDALALIRTAPDHGLVVADYVDQDLSQLIDSENDVAEQLKRDPQALARFDVQLTTALLTLGRDVATGRSTPQSISK